MLNPPREFEFPFSPYDIQHEFMTNLYSTIELQKLGIFESPTGTGKSLSIICGALKWLKDHNECERRVVLSNIEELQHQKATLPDNSTDWIASQTKEIEITKKLNELQVQNKKICEYDKKMEKLKLQKKEIKVKKYFKHVKENEQNLKETVENDENEDENLLPEELEEKCEESEEEMDLEKKHIEVKILICSRTHSQLSQLVNEIVRSPFGKDIRVISLASRQNYCINPTVNKLKSNALINQRCLDMKKGKQKSTKTDQDGRSVKRSKGCSGKCKFLQQAALDELRDEALSDPNDVERLVAAGKELNACPYYASRAAVEDAQVILVPYNMLLHKSTRDASGISIKDNIVIVDEAHNLLEAISHMHSAEVKGHILLQAHSQLSQYKQKFCTRFSAKNLLCINQLLFIIGRLTNVLGGKCSNAPLNNSCNKDGDTRVYLVSDFLTSAEIDNYNMYKIIKFCSDAKISQKLHGFSQKYEASVEIHPVAVKQQEKRTTTDIGVKAFLSEISRSNATNDAFAKTESSSHETNKENSASAALNPLLSVLSFLECLTNESNIGRIVCTKMSTVGKGSLKYLLLNPASHFADIVRDARSVILAGGTMKPTSEFRDRLFVAAGAAPERIYEFSCGHVVPPENILPIALTEGPSGTTLDFSYESRASSDTIKELGRVLCNVCNVIPAGIVCFFGSYEYERTVYKHFENLGVLKDLAKKKRIFREPQSAADVDKVLTDYGKCIQQCKNAANANGLTGALLFSVVGGKLSEGLNFNDDLGRCVVVVGLPYPNIKSPELMDKMTYLDKTEGKGAGNVHYENLCMKAVNQCIGRAVRHRADYATILLLDARYSKKNIQSALPNWILKSLVTHNRFGPAYASINKFFGARKKKIGNT